MEAKKLLHSEDTEKAGFMMLRAHKGFPKSKALIKLLSEEGNKTLLQKTENVYMQENSKRMPEVTSELYFIIEKKNRNYMMINIFRIPLAIAHYRQVSYPRKSREQW